MWNCSEDACNGGERVVFDVDVEEISGICLNSDKTVLLTIGDQGVVKQISFTGEVTHILDFYADMEGVTLDPETCILQPNGIRVC